ncbi:MAG: type II toxin-antitoxin system death-on-curing family toxin [Proteobacteria bacterium]|nr:type II toxin-antitoxin system death-on-curing family toxin [Pseudomonadota bacterium]NOG61441.1 type II toxin-antitoxin system death-on-curing family toxin [Pseudomonadota bacterium]
MRDYLTLTEVLGMHAVLMQRYGGATGIRDLGALEAALYRPQSGYYENIIQEAAALMESLAINHPFIDGNKRIAFAAMDVFLKINGYCLNQKTNEIYKKIMGMFDNQQLDVEHIEAWLKDIVIEV